MTKWSRNPIITKHFHHNYHSLLFDTTPSTFKESQQEMSDGTL